LDGEFWTDLERGKIVGKAQQIIGREGETATLLSTGLFNLTLRGFGFAPRQFGVGHLLISI